MSGDAPPMEANVMFIRPELETEEEYAERDAAEDEAALKPYLDKLNEEARINSRVGAKVKDM